MNPSSSASSSASLPAPVTVPARVASTGFRQWFSPLLLDTPQLTIRGLGVREPMRASMVRRPQGTSDYLLMLFHDDAMMGTSPVGQTLQPSESLMIWPPGKAQHYGNADKPFRHSWIHCEGRRVPRILRTAGLPILTPFPVGRPAVFQQCMLDIQHELVAYGSADGVVIGNLLENALHSMARAASLQTESSGAIPEKLLAVRRLIASSPARSLTLREMAAMAGMSASHFSCRFRERFGVSPVECLIQQRMHYAAHLLGNRNLSIAEVGAMAGYEDSFQFSKIYKKHMGMSPRDYREQKC